MAAAGRGVFALAVGAMAVGVAAAQTPITLSVDLRDAPKKIIHASETIPVTPGALTLVYPKWIPGEHGPTGPIDNQAGLFITANGKPLKWERDPVEMYSFHLTVPSGVTELQVKMDYLATPNGASFSAGGSMSANLAVLSWNTVVLYPYSGPETKASDVMITPSFTLPAGWRSGTALEPAGSAPGDVTKFKTVSLEQLVDSPVLAGRFFREVELSGDAGVKHYLDMAADGPEDVAISQVHIDQFSKLVQETGALYKSRHYGSYHFLVTLSITSPATTVWSPQLSCLTASLC
jgi:predicted metalloprotease with PDZ domain